MTVWACSSGGKHDGGGVDIVCGNFAIALEWLERCHRKAVIDAEHMNEWETQWAAEKGRVPRDDKWVVSPIKTQGEGAEFEDNINYWVVQPMPVLSVLLPPEDA